MSKPSCPLILFLLVALTSALTARADVIVLGDWITAYGTSSDWIRQLSIQNGYVLNQRIAGIEIYTLPPDARR